ncbi:hypothetical protein KN1_11420 [Stygiolobus caldivivus]|uniref:Uncharacterized protein n=1 Tax=Stygiolobus caldivivus TaxID=2824673 RepID=A0A8D5U694_9CREN|nr:hypothetical protein KN1_11420 [Stygiolobus caldivivus]
MEEFACLDYDKACEGNMPKADSICFHIHDCNKVTVYVVERKERLDPSSGKFDDAVSQVENTTHTLSNLCSSVECKKVLVCEYITALNVRKEKFASYN